MPALTPRKIAGFGRERTQFEPYRSAVRATLDSNCAERSERAGRDPRRWVEAEAHERAVVAVARSGRVATGAGLTAARLAARASIRPAAITLLLGRVRRDARRAALLE